jgi:hypothetical protein
VIIFTGNGIIYLKLSRDENWREKQPKKYIVRYSTQGLCCPLSDSEMLFDPINEK